MKQSLLGYILPIRVMCLAALEDYDSCVEVVSASISQHGPLPDLLIIRARINYMFGNVCTNLM